MKIKVFFYCLPTILLLISIIFFLIFKIQRTNVFIFCGDISQIFGGLLTIPAYAFQLWKITNNCDLNIVAVWATSFTTFLFEVYAVNNEEDLPIFLITNTLSLILSTSIFTQVILSQNHVVFPLCVLPLYFIPTGFVILKLYYNIGYPIVTMLVLHMEKLATGFSVISNLFQIYNFLKGNVTSYSIKQSSLLNFAQALSLVYAISRSNNNNNNFIFASLIILTGQMITTMVYALLKVEQI